MKLDDFIRLLTAYLAAPEMNLRPFNPHGPRPPLVTGESSSSALSFVPVPTSSVAPAVVPSPEPALPETTSVVVQPTPDPIPDPVPELSEQAAPIPQPTPDPSPEPQPQPSPEPAPESPPSAGGSMIDTVNSFRTKAGLGQLSWDDKLVSNAANAGAGTGGKTLVHKMNPGSYGQVMVFGFEESDTCGRDTLGLGAFGLSYYSWLCEVPSDAALGSDFCSKVLKTAAIDPQGQTGHYEILSSARYKKIGCAFARDPSAKECGKWTGIWTCDVA